MALVKENGPLFKLLKGQIEKDIKSGAIEEPTQYEYRLNMINTFDGVKITELEAEQLRILISPYAPISVE